MRSKPILRHRRATIAFALTVITATNVHAQQAPREPARQRETVMTLVTYEIGDLVVTVPDYALEIGRGAGAAQYTGGGFRGGGMGGGMGGFGGGGVSSGIGRPGGFGPGGMGAAGEAALAPGPAPITIESVNQVIMAMVAPGTWQPSGGEGLATVLGTTLVVRQAHEVHQEIAQLLEALRSGSATRQTVAIDARWLQLDSDDLEKLVVHGENGKSAVDRQVLAEFTRRPTSLRGITNCFSGQLVYLISGTRRSSVSSYIPVVGSVEPPKPEIMFASYTGDGTVSLVSDEQRSVGYQPVITTNNFGVQIELRPTRLHNEDAAVVDLKSTITFPGSPTDPAVIDASTDMLAPKVDRIAIQTQELATTLRIPIGEPTLVGGMTYVAPEAAGSGDHGEAAAPAPGAAAENRQLYLILELR